VVASYEQIQSTNSATGVDLGDVGLRLTLTTGVPITTTDVTGASTIYYTPAVSGRIALYNGSIWIMYSTAEVSKALSSLTSGKNYDVFAYYTGTAVALELSAAWTNDTTRADALAQQDGVWVKSSAHTRRWIGTIRTTGTTTTEDSQAKRFTWNVYNQAERKLQITEATASWASTSAAFRAANNNSANCFEYVTGFTEILHVKVRGLADTSNATSVAIASGIGIDSTTVNSADLFGNDAPAGAAISGPLPALAEYDNYVAFGYHKITWLEYGGTGVTFFGQGTPYQAGMVGDILA
jgi:hypothetical protein